MKLTKAMTVVALAAAAVGSAHANFTASTVGLTTTYTENFNAGSSFSGGALTEGGADDFLTLQGGGAGSTATYSFTFATGIASLGLSFWYTGSGTGNVGSVTLERTSPNPDTTVFTNSFTAVGGTGNPGPGTGLQFVSPTFTNLVAGTYELTFARISGGMREFRVDDVVVTVSSVPEPATIAMMLAGLGLVGVATRRKRPSATF